VENNSGGSRTAGIEYFQFLKRVVAQTRKGQLSTSRPSMLMQVRTEEMGRDFFVDEELLREVFLASTEAPHLLEPLFGAVPLTLPRDLDLETNWEPFRPHLSAFIYLDGARDEAYIVENPHCNNPISAQLRDRFVSAGAKLVR
jgi:hypothetical protein